MSKIAKFGSSVLKLNKKKLFYLLAKKKKIKELRRIVHMNQQKVRFSANSNHKNNCQVSQIRCISPGKRMVNCVPAFTTMLVLRMYSASWLFIAGLSMLWGKNTNYSHIGKRQMVFSVGKNQRFFVFLHVLRVLETV